MYATFAAGGVRCSPIGVTGLDPGWDRARLPVASADCPGDRSAHRRDHQRHPKQNIDGSDPYRTAQRGSIGRPAIGKTGTAGDFAAAWFAGATPQMATAVWMGDPAGGVAHPLTDVTVFGQNYPELFGGQAPALLWQQFMSAALNGKPTEQFPAANKPALPAVGVPNVVGMPLDAAVGALHDAGFTVAIAPSTQPAAQDLPANYVVKVDPAAGTDRNSGTPVTLTLSPGSRTDVQVR